MKYYIAIDKNDVIWGIGESPKESELDAKFNIRDRRGFEKSRPKIKTLECTKEVYDDVFVNGYHHGDGEPYWSYDGMIKMAYYPQKQTRQNVFKTLP